MVCETSDSAAAPIANFYREKSWIEGAAVDQLVQVASMPGIRSVAAMPDLCPGKYGPVGCAIHADNIHPFFVGSDIGCGMGLFQFDLPVRKVRPERAAEQLCVLEPERDAAQDADWMDEVRETLEAFSLTSTPFDAALGTIGGGNHFCELQAIEEIVDAQAAADAGLDAARAVALVHSGSRGLGHAILDQLMAEGAQQLELESAQAEEYLCVHNEAVRWAKANRVLVAKRAARALRADLAEVIDQPHNFLEVSCDGVIHRKGAAPADRGLVPVPGSRGTLSYLVKPIDGPAEALASIAHGAGRRYNRGAMHGRAGTSKSDRDALARNPFGGRVVCTSRDLLVEEAPEAYKAISQVIDDLVACGLVKVVATFRPIVTFKTARQEREAGQRGRGGERDRNRSGRDRNREGRR